MNIKNISKTKTAFFTLLLHVLYAALFAVFMLLAGLTEVPCNNEGIYEIFAFTSVTLLCLYPFVTTGINAASIVFQALALRQNESKVKNIVMMTVALVYEALVIVFFAWFWRGTMGV